MERYKVSTKFENLGFKYQASNHGTAEKYVYEDTQIVVPRYRNREVEAFIRIFILIDLDTGKPSMVLMNLAVNNDIVEYFNQKIDIRKNSGEECEKIAINLLRDELNTYNRVLGSHFSI